MGKDDANPRSMHTCLMSSPRVNRHEFYARRLLEEDDGSGSHLICQQVHFQANIFNEDFPNDVKVKLLLKT